MKTNNKPFAVYTQDRISFGQRPYIVWGASEQEISSKWNKRFGERPVKIVPAYWDSGSAEYQPVLKSEVIK